MSDQVFDNDLSYFDDLPQVIDLGPEDWPQTESLLEWLLNSPETTCFESPNSDHPPIALDKILEAPDDTSVPSEIIVQEPAPSTENGPGPTSTSQRVHGRAAKTSEFLLPEEKLTWNCYRCDYCGYTSDKVGYITRHIQRLRDHDPLTVSVSWVGDSNVKLARGFINGEPLNTRLQRLARESEDRKALKRKAKDKGKWERKKWKTEPKTPQEWVHFVPEEQGEENRQELFNQSDPKVWVYCNPPHR
ncbi:hypothetical protein L211DRAFT_853674 [Terfezia boudieri ATCC MYA-4762]|uniref:Uncharacterized protein n=1 Tax=Terfezia boudieri ATCC MYA-4762 TaxID=1051890 RepID=A0A3N4L7P2_9PEZI|nr:hypothetical protein L211DRAFT_853674 [Terfezia boudieri ATCC MYA-4762]